jgi:hypothetical protein
MAQVIECLPSKHEAMLCVTQQLLSILWLADYNTRKAVVKFRENVKIENNFFSKRCQSVQETHLEISQQGTPHT